MAFRRPKPDFEPRGSKSYSRAPLNSYYRSKNPANDESPFKKKPAKSNTRKVLLGAADTILAIVLLAGLVYSLLLKPQPKIEASNLTYRSAFDYNQQITPMFGGFKDSNKITFDDKVVISAIEKRFPEVRSVRVELPFFSEKPVVRLDISPPVFKLLSPEGTYIIDTEGIAVAKAADYPKLDNLVSISDQSGFETLVGKQVLSSQSVNFINTVIEQSKNAKVPISSLTLPLLAQEIDLRTADEPYYVKFYLGGDALSQSGQFLAARQKFKTASQPAQYLDVRVPGKIFYK